MTYPLLQIDAFSDRPFCGNPAAVCVLPQPEEATWMQQVAAEMNLSETAFVYALEDGFNLRWFTPEAEVELCGHATLATAHALWELGHLAPEAEARFHTLSGVLTAAKQGDWIELNFPAKAPEACTAPESLERSLGVAAAYVGKSNFDYLIQVASETELRGLQPDFALLKTIPVRGVIVTARSDNPAYDFVSRFFAPAVGISEDPVTGSAHCCLAPFWSDRLHKQAFLAYQASARGGVLRVRLEGDRVVLGGQAVTVLRGELASDR